MIVSFQTCRQKYNFLVHSMCPFICAVAMALVSFRCFLSCLPFYWSAGGAGETRDRRLRAEGDFDWNPPLLLALWPIWLPLDTDNLSASSCSSSWRTSCSICSLSGFCCYNFKLILPHRLEVTIPYCV